MMKKILALALSATVCMASCLLTGCSREAYRAGSYTADTQIREISIAARDRRIEFLRADVEAVTLAYFENSREYYDIQATEGRLTVTLVYDKDWTDFIGTKGDRDQRVVRVLIPGAAPDKIHAQTTNADILYAGISVSDSCTLSVNKGSIVLTDAAVGNKIELTAKDGDITGTIVGSYDIFEMKVSVKKGESNLTDKVGGSKSLKLDVNNGNIRIGLVEQQNKAA